MQDHSGELAAERDWRGECGDVLHRSSSPPEGLLVIGALG